MKKIFYAFAVFCLPLFMFLLSKQNAVAAIPAGNFLEINGGIARTVNSTPPTPSAVTFELWVKPISVSGIQKILSLGDPSTSDLHYELSINGGSLSLTYRHGQGGTVVITSGQVSANAWNHLAVTISGSQTKLFVNGQVTTQPNIALSQLKSLGPNIVLAGSYLGQLGNPGGFKGSVDELRISKSVRDISSLWNGGVYQNGLPTDTDTYLLWHLDEPRGNINPADSSGNGLQGILIGGDSAIHFFGILPTPTPFSFPTIGLRWTRPILPTLSFPNNPPSNGPTATPQPTSSQPTPTQSLIDSRHLQTPRSTIR